MSRNLSLSYMLYEEFLKHIGLKIKYYRLLKNYSQAYISEKADIKESYISDIENGKRNITLKTFYKIAEILDVEYNKFFKIDE